MLEWIIIIILLTVIFFLFLEYSDLRGSVEAHSRCLFEEWKQKELDQIRTELEQQSDKNAQLLFQEWVQKEEERIRKDAIDKKK